MIRHYKKIRLLVDSETFNRIISGEQKTIVREYNHYWRRKLIHPRSLDLFPNIILVFSVGFGKSIVYYAYCKGIDIKGIEENDTLTTEFIIHIGKPFDPELLK
ncbi:MAG: hypothetical protein LUF90_10255 [Rikenellaceae bacterium]|nr:hypothetical protein [Rikenellaceae bacterium]